ncbi:sulfotransferase [Thalassococcus sp. CAU 1522]|uniref:Sulfotransferase n=1 Tax=Thalassococcus arenae TaxID=2851652 RepID=A0ABS6N4D9_9RHOB|nr:sulfotransferase [Thalassococcus arenae]MBV2358878.1 sulfotransferase [Thalassococcus arenae]
MLSLPAAEKRRLFAEALAHRKARRFDAAKDILKRLMLSEPGNAELHFLMSQVAYDEGDRDQALQQMAEATRHAPENAKLLTSAAERFAQLQANDLALAAFDRLIALDPKAVAPRANRARHLQVMGRLDEAEAELRKLIARHEADLELYRILLGTVRPKPNDPILRKMERFWTSSRMNDEARMNLGFALAKAMEDTGQFDRVFGFLAAANQAQRKLAPYSAETLRAETDRLLAAQDGAELTPADGVAEISSVFVCGMPRSGTTLAEQILGQHSAVTAGGELGHAYRQAILTFGDGDGLKPLSSLSSKSLRLWADRYQRMVRRDTGATSPVVTDKSMRTERLFGYIRRGIPGAGMIVIHRDPRDIALSIYKNHFALGTHRYANDLADIAFVIKLFRRSVALWRDRMPGIVHEVRYEDLVMDPEPHARALVAAAGLDWQESCLRIQDSKSTVQTLSLAQVRQPIHAGRRQAWRRYETEMAPFIDAWGDEPWD